MVDESDSILNYYYRYVRELEEKQKQEKEMETPTKTAIVPYNKFSKGAKALKKGLGFYTYEASKLASLIYGGSYKPDTIINWGCTKFHDLLLGQTIINNPKLVLLCSDKTKFFDKVSGHVRIPEFTKNVDEAMSWVNDGIVVLGRSSRGSCGADIKWFDDDPVGFTASDFFVKYKKKKAEYRIHVFKGKVIDQQQKVLRSTDTAGNPIDKDSVDFRIRNHKNGFIFQRFNMTVPEDVVQQALKAMEVIGLDFGAVDVIYNAYENKAYVLEINTAPGLEGTTVDNYITAFKELGLEA